MSPDDYRFFVCLSTPSKKCGCQICPLSLAIEFLLFQLNLFDELAITPLEYKSTQLSNDSFESAKTGIKPVE